MIIYKTTNNINKKVYIGQTIKSLNKRKKAHLYNSTKGYDNYLYRAIRKYGENNFKWEVLCECNSNDELNEKEQYYIKKYDSYGDGGYNMTAGGEGIFSYRHTEKHKKFMSKRMSGKNNPMYGRDRSGKNNPMYGIDRKGQLLGPKFHTEETKKKIRQKLLGRKISKETIEKISRKVECPHCNKQGGITAMNRWHFDSCKELVVYTTAR